MERDVFTTLGFGPTGYGMQFLGGMSTTALVCIASYLAALAGGCVLGIAGAAGPIWARGIWRAYRSIFSGVPTLLLIFFLFFGIPFIDSQVFGGSIEISPFVAGVVSLSLIYAAYAGEVIRGAILNVPRGQFEACRALGLGRFATAWVVINPQVLRLALPGLSNNWVVMLKDTALVSVIGLADVVRVGQIAGSFTKRPLLFLSLTGLFYVVVVIGSTGILRIVQRRLDRGYA